MGIEPLWAQLDLSEHLLTGLRIAAGLGGALVGWVLSNPILQLGYRVIAGQQVPGWVVPWVRLLCAGVLGVLAYFLVSLGGGSGLGWGPGLGGGPGKGPGEGTGVTKVEPGPKAKETPPARDKARAARDVLDIELLGGPRYLGDGRFYLMQRQAPPRSLEEVEADLKKRGERIEVRVILTEQSVGRHHEAVTRLRTLLDRLQIPAIETDEGEKKAKS